MAVRHGDAYAMRADNRRFGGNNHAIFDVAPDFERLLLALFFLATDVRNDVVNHLRPALKGFASAGNCLIGGNDYARGL